MRKLVGIVAILLCAGLAFANGDGEAAAAVDLPVLDGYKSVTEVGINFQWRVNGSNLDVQIAAPTTGWVAVGFDPSRQMADANIIIGYVEDGQVFLSDQYGIGAVRHGPDADNGGVDNLSNVEGEETETGTVIRFTIPLDSGDSLDNPLAAGRTHKVIVAHGPDNSDDFGTYHATRGSTEVEL